MKKSLLSVFLFVMTLAGFSKMAKFSWGGIQYVSVDGWRSPSAIHGLRDFSSLRGSSLSEAAEDYFVSQSDLIKTPDGVEVQLNQFVITDEDGQRNFVCRVEGRAGVYDRVELKLKGLGISEAGRQPSITVETDCLSEENPKEIGKIVVKIPMSEIFSWNPKDQYVRFFDAKNSRVRVSDMVSQWPMDWRLEEVQYKSSIDKISPLSFKASQKKGSRLRALNFELKPSGQVQ
tara:strand:+ start:175 stop:870 length:696 start_codon:yes stop_codon:yes gene_type:complete